MMKAILLIFIVLSSKCVDSARILVTCPFLGKSHSRYIHPIVMALADQGHEITMISTNLVDKPPKNLHQIQPDPSIKLDVDHNKIFDLSTMPTILHGIFVVKLMTDGAEKYISAENVAKFIEEDNSHYDLVMVELFFQEAFYGFAYKYQAPIVLLGTATYWHVIDDYMGNPSTIPYLGHEFSREFGDMNLLQRVHNFFLSTIYKLTYRYYSIPKHQKMLEKYFPNLPKPMPSIEDLEKNVSLVLFNTHFSMDAPRPLVPGIVEIAGVHLKPPKKLPEDLQKFLDGATDGFIYFSLGSNLRSAGMPKDKLEGIVRAFSKLKQRVLWKWEDDNLPNLSQNVLTAKWLPQSDVLAHPNIRIFITQTGMLSTQEAVDRGVPLIGLPVYGDQHLNMAKIEYLGMGISLPFNLVNEQTLLEAINKVLSNPKYSQTAKEMSARFKDRPLTPIQTAVFWIEYVIRHKGARFMKSKLADTPFYQYHLLDVYAVVFVSIVLILYALKCLFRAICGICRKSNKKSKPTYKKTN